MTAEQKCKTCIHPSRVEIEEQLLLGVPLRAIAKRFSCGRSSLARHLERHVGPRIERAARAKDQLGALDLWRRLSEIEVRARRIADAAERAEDFRGATGALREMARVVEMVARLRGEFEPPAPGSVVNVLVDEATAVRMAQVFLRRRALREPIAAEAQLAAPATAEPEAKS